MVTLFLVFIGLFQTGPSGSNPSADSLLLRFNDVAREANHIQQSQGIGPTIEFFKSALNDVRNDDFGQFHLRLGQLYKAEGKNALSAYHFLRCHRDRRVAPMDRDFICWDGFRDVTATLTVTELPAGGQVNVIEPREFEGPFNSGARLPRGRLVLEVTVPNHRARRSELALNGPLSWRAQFGMLERDEPLIPDALIEPDLVEKTPESPTVRSAPVRWPSYVLGAAGLALVGTGVFIGVDNQGTLEDIRDRQRRNVCGADFCNGALDDSQNRAYLADGLWGGGALFLATSLVLWFVLDGEDSGADR
ncbi:MAG: hypothetical protein VX589_12560 [Myxococcota bacterium]|nr:hypothetical protein [Myxococcota bacterium]